MGASEASGSRSVSNESCEVDRLCGLVTYIPVNSDRTRATRASVSTVARRAMRDTVVVAPLTSTWLTFGPPNAAAGRRALGSRERAMMAGAADLDAADGRTAGHGTGSSLRRRAARGRCIAISGANTFLGRNIVGVLEEDDSVGRIVV